MADFTTENRGNRTSLKEFEKDLLKERKLRLKPFMKKNVKGKFLNDFVLEFILDFNDRIPTVYVDSEEVQTEPKRRRSAGDIFRICRYYYPTCTFEEVLVILDSIEAGNGIKSQMCRGIKKRVFSAADNDEIMHLDEKDEFGRKPGQYRSKASV